MLRRNVRNRCRNIHRVRNSRRSGVVRRSNIGRVASHLYNNFSRYHRAYRTVRGAYNGYKLAGPYGAIGGAIAEQI